MMATKRFDLKDAKEDFETATRRSHTNWELCFICQEPSKEILECSAKRSTHLDKSAGYRNVADQLKKFQAIGQLATNIDNRIGETSSGDLSDQFVTNEAKFHKRCKNKYDRYHYQKKRKQPLSESAECPPLASTRARYSATNFQLKCFFCEKEDTNHNLTQAQTLGLDRKVRDAATALTVVLIYELVRCGCKQNCSSRCKCKQHYLECTELCKCGSQCSEFNE